MSDPALNNQNQSYVDSYVPPTSGQVSVNSASVTSMPVASANDPLKKLEELVAEFENKKDEKKADQLKDLKSLEAAATASKPTSDSNLMSKPDTTQATDPLAELEKALDEYEKKYKDRVAAAKQVNPPVSRSEDKAIGLGQALDQVKAKAPVLPVGPNSESTDKVSLKDLEKAVTEFEQQTTDQDKLVTPVLEQTPSKVNTNDTDESIDEQNIFDLLGVSDASDQEKEAFLDELQQALWEDFLEKDLILLVSEQEMLELDKIKTNTGLGEEQRQAQLIAKIEQLVPDIEEIMLEKALELKEDMVLERLQGIRESFQQANQNEAQLDIVADHFKNGRWKTGTQLLNSL
ncbi:MAG: hypothetical protein IT416_02225 [Candidatus Pacebacteria bacterium]|nr:hypothetical protein [Candidatus Paceibacterota bacterium]